MAEAKKGGAALYGKPPRIETDKASGDTVKSGGGAPKGAQAKAEKTAGSPTAMTENKSVGDSGTNAKGDVMAGTDGIPTHHHTQHAERAELHHRHMMQHVQQHGKHQEEHLMQSMGHSSESASAMHERHHNERRSLHTSHEREMRDMHGRHEAMGTGPSGGMVEKEVGKSGTQPT